jgi:hypothetical protein
MRSRSTSDRTWFDAHPAIDFHIAKASMPDERVVEVRFIYRLDGLCVYLIFLSRFTTQEVPFVSGTFFDSL